MALGSYVEWVRREAASTQSGLWSTQRAEVEAQERWLIVLGEEYSGAKPSFSISVGRTLQQ